MFKIFYRLLYLILKKDMIRKLRKDYGTHFTDNVMKTFGMPTDLTNEYLKEGNGTIVEDNYIVPYEMTEVSDEATE